jgi:(p)ppGpp synthase/HD superfamily hydrolase
MAYSVKIIVHASDEPAVLNSIRKVFESNGAAKVREISFRTADRTTQEVYVELLLEDSNAIGDIIRKVEGIRGAAVTAATEPRQVRLPRRSGP